MQTSPKFPRVLLATLLWLFGGSLGWAQPGAFPSTTPPPGSGMPGMSSVPPAGMAPSAALQPPTFDPYATGSGAAASPPSLLSPPPATPYGMAAPGAAAPYGTAAPGWGQPSAYGQPGVSPYGTPAYPGAAPGYPTYPGVAPPNTGFGTQAPPVLFPQGLFGPSQPAAPYNASGATALKLFQHVRLSETFLAGNSDSPDDLQINDIFATTTIALPNFFWTGQPWFISPGFGLHLWSGPFDGNPAHNLPPNAYSAFLDLGWQSDPSRQFGVEAGGRLGVFSDFDTFDSQSLRPSGILLGRFSLTPTSALKFGVAYINRAEIKLLPAVGWLWTPNPQTRWDIFFPQPKLSSYLTTLGTQELWWYIGGEYGGGVWTAKAGLTPGGEAQLMDINDIRVFLGVQIGPPAVGGVGQRGAFFEAGYVFNREVVFVTTPDDSFSLSNTFMLRGGVAF